MVRPIEVLTDGVLEGAGAAVGAALDLLFRQQRKPALDEVEPRRARRCEMHVEARMSRQPAAHARRLVRPVIVEDEMEVQRARCACIDRLQELEELLARVPAMTFPDDIAGGHIERRKQRRRAMASIVVRAPLRDARLQRRMIRARNAKAWAVVRRRAQLSSVERSSVVSTTGFSGRPNHIGVFSLYAEYDGRLKVVSRISDSRH